MDATTTEGVSVPESPRERLLAAAERRFEQRGIAATGINDLVREADVARMTLYHHFASKDDLVVAYLEHRDADWQRRLETRLAEAAGSEQAIVALVRAYGDRVAREGSRGCVFINAAAELPPDHPGWAVITRHKQSVVDRLAELSRDAGAEDPHELARQVFLLAEGAIVTAGREHSAQAIEQACAAAELLVAASRGHKK